MRIFKKSFGLFILLFVLACQNTNAVNTAICPAAGNVSFPTPDASFKIDLSKAGAAIPSSFLGLSNETSDMLNWTGTLNTALPPPSGINPVLIELLANLELCNNGAPYLRAGGDSADESWFAGQTPAPNVPSNWFPITPDWIAGIAAVSTVTGSPAIVGLNLAAVENPDPNIQQIPGFEVAAFEQFPAGIVQAMEGGNEPDLYVKKLLRFPGYFLVSLFPPAPPFSYLVDFLGFTGAIKSLVANDPQHFPFFPPLGAPVLADDTWLQVPGAFETFLTNAGPDMKLVTQHDFPLNVCDNKQPNDPTYPTIPLLLDDQSSHGQAEKYAPFIQTAGQSNLPFRMTEMNSVACGGVPGVSDTFASALWALDTLFEMASVGVMGVDFHNAPGASYNAFNFTATPSNPFAVTVNPLYYALVLFSQATCNNAQLLPVEVVTAPPGNVKVWSTFEAATNLVRILVLNKDPNKKSNVFFQLSSNSVYANVTQLKAPSLSAKNGVTLAGQTFDGTTDGAIQGSYQLTQICPQNSGYGLTVPAGSATMLTIQL